MQQRLEIIIHTGLSLQRMPSFSYKGSLLAALLVVVSAMGHLHAFTSAVAGPGFSRQQAQQYHVSKEHEKQQLAFAGFFARPSKQTSATEKRHKRLLISKAWQPVAGFTFIKRYRLTTSVTDYSSPHILQRTALVFPLRGPPALAW